MILTRCDCFKTDEMKTQEKKCPMCGLPLPFGVDPFKGAISNKGISKGYLVKLEFLSDLNDDSWEPEGGCHGHPY